MKKTFIQKRINGRDYQFLTLPGANLFKFEIINTFGANIERVMVPHMERKPYGLAHFIEHLGFRATKDHTTEELMSLLKSEGTYNASTDHDRINYWFKTTSQKAPTAINLVCNYALNDLRNIPQDEFELERKVVYNEAKRYADDDQTMFWFNLTAAMCGYHEEDNVIGIPETIAQFTLEDAIKMKQIMQSYGRWSYNVTYDPDELSQDGIVAMIEDQLARFPIDLLEHEVGMDYYDNLRLPRVGDWKINNESEQAMTGICLNVVSNIHASNIANLYLSRYSDTSLTDIIREKNGLTYGVHFYSDSISYVPYTFFGCDVSRGDEGKLMRLFNESIHQSVEAFDEAAYAKLMDTTVLKRVMNNVNLSNYDRWHWFGLWHQEITVKHQELLAKDIDYAMKAMDREEASYSNVKEYLEDVLTRVEDENWSKAYT